MSVSFNSWFCCCLEQTNSVELCKVMRDKGTGTHRIITYYDGKEVYSGSLEQCRKWIETHWIEKRYLEHYGKAD